MNIELQLKNIFMLFFIMIFFDYFLKSLKDNNFGKVICQLALACAVANFLVQK